MKEHSSDRVEALFGKILGENLGGKSLFDINCSFAPLIFEAEKRGAICVGGCTSENELLRFRSRAEKIGSTSTFDRFDLELDGLGSNFDYVVCIGGLEDCRNPLAVLDKLIQATSECLVIGMRRPRFQLEADLSMIASPLFTQIPAILLSPARRRRALNQGLFISPPALVAYLKVLRQDFARVDILEGELTGNSILVARKRKIGHLHLLAGVNSVGKSTLLEKLKSGDEAARAALRGIDPVNPWIHTTYAHLLENTQEYFSHALVQYNITDPAVHGLLHRHEHGLLDLMKSAQKVDVTTMWLPPDVQYARYKASRVSAESYNHLLPHRKSSGSAVPKGRIPIVFRSRYATAKGSELLSLYGNQCAFTAIYENWFIFLESRGFNTSVLFQDPEYRLGTIESWRSTINQQRSHLQT